MSHCSRKADNVEFREILSVGLTVDAVLELVRHWTMLKILMGSVAHNMDHT